MKARQLIDGASFGPEALKAIGQAFDKAWLEIAGNFGDEPGDIERARYRLATALLSVANEDSRDVEVLKQAALERMALNYREDATAWPHSRAAQAGLAPCVPRSACIGARVRASAAACACRGHADRQARAARS